jgi:uncharacterized protein
VRIPSRKQCYQLLHQMEMPDHIVAHSLQVCRVAIVLVEDLKTCRMNLNQDLIEASALLHDITKTRSFKTNENHAVTGNQLLTGLGYPEVGHIVGQHVRLDEYLSSEPLNEAEIVNYADKRVLHDEVVSLRARMCYILKRYGKEPEHRQRIRWLWEKTEQLEDRLFSWLSFPPHKLERILGCTDCTAELISYRKSCLTQPSPNT